MMKFTAIKLSFFVLFTSMLWAQVPQIQHIHPINWWVGMKNPKLQLLVYGKDIATAKPSLAYAGVSIQKVHKVENPNYLFIDLLVSKNAKAGTMKLVFEQSNQKTTVNYTLNAKRHQPQAVTPSDFLYLIMPDRFANGDPTNDKFEDMLDKTADNNNPYLRHGGDFQGIINRLDYLQELGVTTIWNTPVIENNTTLKKELHGNMQAAYHGYHFTNHYAIDKRFGGNEGYKKLSKALHERGMKLVQDAVYNHISEDSWLFKDQPSKDWFNQWESYTGTNHKEQSALDVHGANSDRKLLFDGWFTPFLPDVNQRNPFFANYLIQHAIWSTEEFGIDAWRIDTYKYNDMAFMNRCNQALLEEYPKLLIFGETWVTNPLFLSYFVSNNIKFPFACNLPSTCDFPFYSAVNESLNQPFSWDGGVNRLYQTMAQDFIYKNPMQLVTFLENHDTDRYFSVVGEDFQKYKMGVTWLLTMRGIPQFYYGTEVLMKNFKNPTDAEVRRSFEGGWQGDKSNKFVASGRTAQENEAFEFVKKLANYRKNTPALHTGQLLHFVPQDGIYVYFRYDAQKTIMVVSNTNKTTSTLNTARFAEGIKNHTTAMEVLTNQTIADLKTLTVPAQTTWVLELK